MPFLNIASQGLPPPGRAPGMCGFRSRFCHSQLWATIKPVPLSFLIGEKGNPVMCVHIVCFLLCAIVPTARAMGYTDSIFMHKCLHVSATVSVTWNWASRTERAPPATVMTEMKKKALIMCWVWCQGHDSKCTDCSQTPEGGSVTTTPLWVE